MRLARLLRAGRVIQRLKRARVKVPQYFEVRLEGGFVLPKVPVRAVTSLDARDLVDYLKHQTKSKVRSKRKQRKQRKQRKKRKKRKQRSYPRRGARTGWFVRRETTRKWKQRARLLITGGGQGGSFVGR